MLSVIHVFVHYLNYMSVLASGIMCKYQAMHSSMCYKHYMYIDIYLTNRFQTFVCKLLVYM